MVARKYNSIKNPPTQHTFGESYQQNEGPTKTDKYIKQLEIEIDEHVQKCEFVGEFPSIIINTTTCLESEVSTTMPDYPFVHATKKRSTTRRSTTSRVSCEAAIKALLKASTLMKESISFYKKKASEVVVFTLADSDRTWKKEIGHIVHQLTIFFEDIAYQLIR